MRSGPSTGAYVMPPRFTVEGLDFDALSLLSFDDDRMTTPPPEFDFALDGEHAETLANGMYEKMLKLGGVGLSANQIGLPYRVFVFGGKETRLHMFNPKIIGVSKEMVAMTEACLSLPGFSLVLKRPAEVAASYQDFKGETVVSNFSGIGARIFLHEYDHMEGILFTQHASQFKMRWELDKVKKRIRRYEKAKAKVKRGRK
jgi:peptide deformylase